MEGDQLSRSTDGHQHRIDIDTAAETKSDTVDGVEAERKWLRKLTSATVNKVVMRDLIARTPMLWYLGERSGTILRSRPGCSGRVEALHAVRAVAIGPFHRGDPGLAFPDDAKIPFMRYLQDQCALEVDRYVAALSVERDRLRDEFADDDAEADRALLDDEERFLQMLLLDSCFVLVVSMMLSKAGVGEDADSAARAASINREYFILHMAVAQHAEQIKLDMLVLENQVPFAAVKLLVASCGRLKLRHCVEQVVLGCFDDVCPKRARLPCHAAGAEFHHVLHLFHWSRVPGDQASASSSCQSHLDMSFWSRTASPVAVMSIPCFHVHEYSAVVLYNMLAFEMHFHWAHGACVTTHVARMEGLVRCASDASFLRRRGVLASTRLTDAELVYFFRELGAHTVGARLPDEFGDMLDVVACHRRRRISWWCGGFVLHFFPSPWVAVSLFAAAAIFVVPSLLQTVYTMLGYIRSTSS
ncbi:hypothetical protein ACQ4PT_011901 [Festuca glaucescens]